MEDISGYLSSLVVVVPTEPKGRLGSMGEGQAGEVRQHHVDCPSQEVEEAVEEVKSYDSAAGGQIFVEEVQECRLV